jgi:hypothetical protein
MKSFFGSRASDESLTGFSYIVLRQPKELDPGVPMTWITFERPELYEWKLSCTVLRGERGCKALDLPGFSYLDSG